jgi:NAD(P)H-dependent FMN reductase
MTISLLLGSSRIGRQSAHVAAYLFGRLAGLEGIDVRMLDLADFDFPIMEERYVDMDPPPPGLVDFAGALAGADAIVIVAPEYKNGYPGVLKNALDYLPPNIFRRKPIGICTVSSGGFGGINCLAQLRLVCLAMGGVPIPAHLPVSHVKEWFAGDGGLLNPKFEARADEFLSEFLWYAEALSAVIVR